VSLLLVIIDIVQIIGGSTEICNDWDEQFAGDAPAQIGCPLYSKLSSFFSHMTCTTSKHH
jgi:hypothetical protein